MLRNSRTAIAFALAVSLGTLIATAQMKGSGSKSSDDAQFKKLISEYYAAWNTLNPDNPAKYYAKDADLVFFDIAPMQYKGWNEYHDGVIKHFFSTITAGKLTPNDDLKVTRRGNVAWTTLTFVLSLTPKQGNPAEIPARHTAIWELRGGKWLIVHEHVSTPLPG